METERRSPGLPLISVIIPVYNVGLYLRRCLDSVLRQTYSALEIILVDDGSEDASGRICREYRARDPRIRYYHKDQGGVSDARNYGLDHSHGSYITFVDSDDYVAPDYVEYLYRLIISGESGQSDMAMCSLCVCYSSNGRRIPRGNGRREILTGKECIRKMCYDDQVDTCVYAKLYPASLFEGIRYPSGRIFEDIEVTCLLFDRCDRIACGWMPKYCYVLRENSIVTSPYSPAKLDLLVMTDKMAAYVQKRYPDLDRAVLRRRVYARFSTLNQMMSSKGDREKKIRRKLLHFIKKHGWKVMTDPKTPWRDRAALVSMAAGYPFYRLVWTLYFWWQRKCSICLPGRK